MSNKNEPKITYNIGSNVVVVDGEKKYLTIVLWDKDLLYTDIKEFICK